MKRYTKLGMILLVVSIWSCSDQDEGPQSQYLIPKDLNDGILVADAEAQGIDIELLNEMEQLNLDGTYENVHSILVAYKNQLVYETHFTGTPIYGNIRQWNANSKHNQHSVTKSWNSALVGIAVDQYGLSIDAKVMDFFPEIDQSNWTDGRELITIEDLLIMSSGIQWDEWSFSYDDPRNDHSLMNVSPNWVHFVLTRPMSTTPGRTFLYNSGLSITLGEIVKKHTRKSVESLAREHLFSPLGITDFDWSRSDNRIYQTGGGLSVSSRAMLKFGLMYYNDGVWNGTRVLSEEWANTSTRQQGPNPNYGYQWWVGSYTARGGSYPAYLAAGRGGQYIIVMDNLELVVVFTAGNDNQLSTEQPRDMMQKYIIPSILSSRSSSN